MLKYLETIVRRKRFSPNTLSEFNIEIEKLFHEKKIIFNIKNYSIDEIIDFEIKNATDYKFLLKDIYLCYFKLLNLNTKNDAFNVRTFDEIFYNIIEMNDEYIINFLKKIVFTDSEYNLLYKLKNSSFYEDIKDYFYLFNIIYDIYLKNDNTIYEKKCLLL